MDMKGRERRQGPLVRGLAISLAVLFGLMALNFSTQTLWAHRQPGFRPDSARMELEALLSKNELSRGDYDRIFRQTGLSQAAVDDLLALGQAGVEQILATQAGFYAHYQPHCQELIQGRFTCEDRLVDGEGKPIRAVPLAPLEQGDVILTFSTHTWGWRHGHAGLITDPEGGTVLEAVQLGTDSRQAGLDRWRSYSNFLVLRVKDVLEETRRKAADFAREFLDGVPYSLLSGLLGPKEGQEGDLTVQCAYLPWLAWMQAGVDLDSDGGRVVTVRDLAESPRLEVVQVYGLDPELVLERQSRC